METTVAHINERGIPQPNLTPDQMMKELVGYNTHEVMVKIQSKLIECHDQIETNEEFKTKLAKLLLDSIKETWLGEDIEKEHVKSLNDEEHQAALDWLENKKDIVDTHSAYYNAFRLAFVLNVDEDSRIIQGRNKLFSQDFLDLKIPDSELAHIALSQLFNNVQQFGTNDVEWEENNPTAYKNYETNVKIEKEKFDMPKKIGEIRDRLVREKWYNPSKLW